MELINIQGLQSPVMLEGDTPQLGDFEIQVLDGNLLYLVRIYFPVALNRT